MAFKKVTEYNEEKYANWFVLPDDGDSEEVVILYKDIEDVLVADVHYIKCEDSGYVHCLGKGCPACSKGIRVQPKLFIPLYIPSKEEIVFWDRTPKFMQYTLGPDVFDKYSNPIDFVFSITRRGAASDRNTRYEIQAIARNANGEEFYDSLLKKNDTTMEELYERVCRSWSKEEYLRHMNSTGSESDIPVGDMPEYRLTPRVEVPSDNIPDISEAIADTSTDDLPAVTF